MSSGTESLGSLPADSAQVRVLLEAVHSRNEEAYARLQATLRQRIRGMVRSIAGASSDGDDLEQHVWMKLWTSPPTWDEQAGLPGLLAWVKTVARNAWNSRHRNRQIPQIQSANFEAWLEATYGGTTAPHKLLVCALHVLLHQPIQAIAEMAPVTLSQLADQLISSRGSHGLDILLRNLEGEIGSRKLADFLPGEDAEREIEKWIRSIARDAAARPRETPSQNGIEPVPSSEPIPISVIWQALKLVLSETSAPHQEIAFILNKVLNRKPSEIAEMAAMPLRDVLQHALLQCKSIPFSKLPKDHWENLFNPMMLAMAQPVEAVVREPKTLATFHGARGTAVGLTRFHDFGELAISKWVNAADKRLLSKVNSELEPFLNAVFDVPLAQHKSLTFAHTSLLKLAVSSFVGRCNETLEQLLDDFRAKYLHQIRLKPGRLDTCLAPLASRIREQPRLANSNLNVYLASKDRPGKEVELTAWREEVRARVIGALNLRGRGLLFMYACGELWNRRESEQEG